MWFMASDPRFACQPDRLAMASAGDWRPVEIKTAAGADEYWGEPGSEAIPPYYRVQCLLQSHILGTPETIVWALTNRLAFNEYRIKYDPDEAQYIVDKCTAFLERLEAGIQPDLDGHDATYQAVRELHPLIDGEAVELPIELAAELIEAKEELDEAKDDWATARSEVAAFMGTAKYARCREFTIATRSAKGEGIPYVTTARNAPTLEQLLAS
jgi:hypothetical protein